MARSAPMTLPGWLFGLLLALLAGSAWSRDAAFAQTTQNERGAAGRVETDPETGEQYRMMRPMAPLRRGVIQTSSWGIIVVGVLVVAASATYFAYRIRRWRR